MKKLAVLICSLCVLQGVVFAGDTNVVNLNQNVNKPSKEELIQKRKAREVAFEQKLGLTEAQKAQAKEIRKNGHEKMKPVIDEIIAKKQEIKTVKLSRIAVQAQEEKIEALTQEIKELEKKAHEIRKQNMKEFESILTKKQKNILKQMKKEGRKRFEEHRKAQAMKATK